MRVYVWVAKGVNDWGCGWLKCGLLRVWVTEGVGG